MKSTGSFTIKSHNFSKWLSNDHFDSLVEEISKSFSIFIEVSWDESLIGSVEEWEQVVSLDHFINSFPLVESWVNTSWVVGASVEKNSWSWSSVLKVFNQTFKIKTLSLFVEISISSNIHTGSCEHGFMVTPCWVWNVDWTWSMLDEEFTNNSKSTCSWESLASSNSSWSNIWVVETKENSSSSLIESLITIDWKIFLIESMVICDFHFSVSDNWENEWLTIWWSISSNTEVNFIWVGVVFVSGWESENSINWCLLDMAELTCGFLSCELVVEII